MPSSSTSSSSINSSITLKRISPLLENANEKTCENIIDYKSVKLAQRKNLSIIQVSAFKNTQQQLSKRLKQLFDIACPETAAKFNSNSEIQLVWNSPNSWLVICQQHKQPDLFNQLLEAVAEFAAVVDQSHARCALRLSGKAARQVMAKNCALDFHPSVFSAASSAQSNVAGIQSLILQIDKTPTYDLFVDRSLAVSFARLIEDSCVEFAPD